MERLHASAFAVREVFWALGLLLGGGWVSLSAQADEKPAAEVKQLDFSKAKWYGSPAFVAKHSIQQFALSEAANFAVLVHTQPDTKSETPTSIDIWSIPQGSILKTIPSEVAIAGVAFSPKEEFLAVGTAKGLVVVYSTDDWSPTYRFDAPTQGECLFAFFRDNRTLMMVDSAGQSYVFDLEKNRLKTSVNSKLKNPQLCGTINGTKAWILGSDADNGSCVAWIDTDKGATGELEVHTGRVAADVIESDHALVIAANGRTRRIDLKERRLSEWSELVKVNQAIQQLGLVSGGNRMIVSMNDQLSIVDLNDPKSRTDLGSYVLRKLAMARRVPVFAAADGNRLRIWDLRKQDTNVNAGHVGPIDAIHFAQEAQTLASTDGRYLYLWQQDARPTSVAHISTSVTPRNDVAEAPRCMMVQSGTLYLGPRRGSSCFAINLATMESRRLFASSVGATTAIAMGKRADAEVLWMSCLSRNWNFPPVGLA